MWLVFVLFIVVCSIITFNIIIEVSGKHLSTYSLLFLSRILSLIFSFLKFPFQLFKYFLTSPYISLYQLLFQLLVMTSSFPLFMHMCLHSSRICAGTGSNPSCQVAMTRGSQKAFLDDNVSSRSAWLT